MGTGIDYKVCFAYNIGEICYDYRDTGYVLNGSLDRYKLSIS
jgi:hypothetical protein